MKIEDYLKNGIDERAKEITAEPDINALHDRSKSKKRSLPAVAIPSAVALAIIATILAVVSYHAIPTKNTVGITTTTLRSPTTMTSVGSTSSMATKPGSSVGTVASTTQANQSSTTTTQPSVTTTTIDPNPKWSNRNVAYQFGGQLVSFTGVACPSVNVCYAIASTEPDLNTGPTSIILVTTNGGQGWSLSYQPTAQSRLESISCASSQACVVGGFNWNSSAGIILNTTDSGALWTNSTVMGGTTPDTLQVSCPSGDNLCIAAGYPPSSANASNSVLEVLYSNDGGLNFSESTSVVTPYNGYGSPYSLSCSSSGICMMTAVVEFPSAPGRSFGEVSTDGGKSWNPEVIPTQTGATDNLADVNCYSNENCIVVGSSSTNSNEGILWKTTNAGLTWSTASTNLTAFPWGDLNASSFSCVSGQCHYTTQSNGNVLEVDPNTLNVIVVDSLNGSDIYALSCSTTSNCIGFYTKAIGSLEPSQDYAQLILS
ncbi:MAG: hypothetical protein HKL80_11490 [Acidimicrobiales bacterium]|nr:hypothetical protein [Acidimicrobiales bacterium]